MAEDSSWISQGNHAVADIRKSQVLAMRYIEKAFRVPPPAPLPSYSPSEMKHCDKVKTGGSFNAKKSPIHPLSAGAPCALEAV